MDISQQDKAQFRYTAMSLKLIEPKTEYDKDSSLKPEDVKVFMDWVNKQPHLPEINEQQAILFLQSCYYRNEAAKAVIDKYFTMKTLCRELFLNRNPLSPINEAHTNVMLMSTLPQKSPEGYTIFLIKFMDLNPDNYDFGMQIKHFDMVVMRHLYQEGTSNGHLIIYDMKDIVFGHFVKVGPFAVQKLIYYLQDAIPIRLKGLHFFNIVPFMDKVLALAKPFMKAELLDLLHLHQTVDGLLEFIPVECLPKEYGGEAPSIYTLHETSKSTLRDNAELFKWEDGQMVDESKRPGKPTTTGDLFGVEGTFKKLEID